MARKRRCKKCGCLIEITSRNPDQFYCSKKECQRARKTKWQRKKMATDEDYRLNQAAASKRWREKNRGYWKKYRKRNQEYTNRNREKQRQRNRSRTVAKDANGSILTPIAKMDALIVKIDAISDSYAHNRAP